VNNSLEHTQCPCCHLDVLTHGFHSGTVWYRGHRYDYKWEGWYCNTCGDGVVKYCEEEEKKWVDFRDQVNKETSRE
jgi:hypothetical protein